MDRRVVMTLVIVIIAIATAVALVYFAPPHSTDMTELSADSDEFEEEPKDPLCLTVLDGDCTIKYSGRRVPEMPLEYNENGVGWIEWSKSIQIVLSKGEYVYVRNTTSSLHKEEYQFKFIIEGDAEIKVSGDISSMINYGQLSENCYEGLFSYNPSITDASELKLPAEELKSNCYNSLFAECTSLEKLPKLSAEKLAPNCYERMFANCAISTLPDDYLLATDLADGCYISMFMNCKLLQNIPKLEATELKSECYSGMFEGCSLLSIDESFVLPATTLANGCYYYMFQGCTNLINAPELPATELAEKCYYYMFYGCTNLINAPELPATKLADSCYTGMFQGCTNLINAPELPATELTIGCYACMFQGCTNLINAPELPAKKLANECCGGMFIECTSLTDLPANMLPATKLADSCYHRMFVGCENLTNMPDLPATTLASTCYREMFSGCTKLTETSILPATKLESESYWGMFDGCSKLEKVVCYATNISAERSTTYWLRGVATQGTFYTPKDTGWDPGASGIPENWSTPSTYRINLDPNGGEIDYEYAMADADSKKLVTKIPAPRLTGYTAKWYLGEYEVDENTEFTSDGTITAQWTPNTYEVSFMDGETLVEKINETYNSKYFLPAEPSKTGYTFAGWFTAETGGTQITAETDVKITKAQILYAHWEGEVYDIEYLDQGGEAFSGMHEGGYPKTHTYGTETALKGAKKPGYKFMGWHEDIDCLEPPIVTLGETAFTDDIKLYAKWEVEEYTITFDTKGGSEIDPIKVKYGEPIPETAVPTKDGFEFDGWDPELPETMPAKNLKVTAKWILDEEHEYIEKDSIPKGEPLKMSIKTTNRPEWVFVYVNGKPEGPLTEGTDYTTGTEGEWLTVTLTSEYTGKLEDGGYSIEVILENKDVARDDFTVQSSPGPSPGPTPKPVPVPAYFEVSYDINGGSEPGPGTMLYKEGASTYVASYIGYKDGYTFGGWSCNGKTYQAGDVFTVNGDMKFTAIWNAVPGPSPEPSGNDNTGMIVGIVVAVVVAIALVGGAMYLVKKR